MRLPGFLRHDQEAAPSSGNGKSVSSARSRIQRILAVLVVLDGVLLFLAFRPPGPSLAEREAEFSRSRAQYETALSTVKQMHDLQTKFQSALQNDQQFSQDHFLQRKTAFSAMLTDLERLASQNQLKTSDISYELTDDTKQQGLVGVEVTMTLEGEYSDLVHFINRLEQSQLFWITDSLNVVPSTGRGLRLSIRMGTYAISS
jgi:hypothetical protein